MADARYTLRSEGRPPFTLRVPFFTVSVGEVVGIVGPNGSGKTTLAKLLVGLYTPEEGWVHGSQGGTETVPIDRAEVELLPQRPVWFEGSLADNISLFDRQADRRKVAEAVEAAGLRPLVDGLPAGLETTLEPATAGAMSSGELQRVALARVLCRDSDIIVLDEPSSGLDGGMVRDLPNLLLRERARRGFVIVTHSDNLIGMCDRLYRLGATDGGSTVFDVVADSLVRQ